ncbi:hypothetical protein L9F63_027506, partial [Diploptera punctata]
GWFTPDYELMWNTLPREQIACRLSSGYVCAKWTSLFEDSVEYTMHLCTRITVEGEGAMTSGCITSTANNTRRTELCACRTYPGNNTPCNLAPHVYHSTMTPVILTALPVIIYSLT